MFLLIGFSQDLFEGIVLLVFAAVLASFLFPTVKSLMDNQKLKRRKKLETVLTLQAKQIDLQSQLLEDLSDTLWGYQFLALEPSYFLLRKNQEGFLKALSYYDEKAPLLLSKVRSLLGKVKRLAPKTYPDVQKVYFKFLTVDEQLALISETKGDQSLEQLNRHHEFIFRDIANLIDQSLTELSQAFGLLNKGEVVMSEV